MRTLIKSARVYTCAGPMLPQGDILLENGLVKEVAPEITACADEIIDARGLVATPGIVDSHTHLGGFMMHGNMEMNEMVKPDTPDMDVLFSLDPNDGMFEAVRKGGITTACVAPGSGNVLCGTVAVIKPVGKTVSEMLMKNNVALKCATGGNPTRFYGGKGRAPMTRMGVMAIFKDYFTRARIYMEKQAKGIDVPYDQGLENICKVIRHEMPLKIHSYQMEILQLVHLFKELDVDYTIDHAFGTYEFADDLLNHNCKGVILGPMGQARKQTEALRDIEMKSAVVLDKLGIPVAIMTDGPRECADMLLWQAGEAIRHGGDHQRVLNMITINPAKIIGVGDRVGSLEPGKDGDVVLFKGVPCLDVGARVVRTIIGGKTVYCE